MTPPLYRSYFDGLYTLSPDHAETKQMDRAEAVDANIQLVKEYQASLALEIEADTHYGQTKSILKKWYATQK
jgi:hypothetical protein